MLYQSLAGAVQTASLVAAPHGLAPVALDELIECDVGSWEGLDWQAIRRLDADGYRRFHADPAEFGYPGGESFRTVHERAFCRLWTSCSNAIAARPC